MSSFCLSIRVLCTARTRLRASCRCAVACLVVRTKSNEMRSAIIFTSVRCIPDSVWSHLEPKHCGQALNFGDSKPLPNRKVLIATVTSLQLVQQSQLEVPLPIL